MGPLSLPTAHHLSFMGFHLSGHGLENPGLPHSHIWSQTVDGGQGGDSGASTAPRPETELLEDGWHLRKREGYGSAAELCHLPAK